MPLHIRLGLAVVLFCSGTMSPAAPEGDDALIQLLQTRHCRECQLADVDLVHAQLQDADLEGAKLQRANLSQARLDGANLRDAELSFTSLNGASLRGANLQGSSLLGTDLRDVKPDPPAQSHQSTPEAAHASRQGPASPNRGQSPMW